MKVGIDFDDVLFPWYDPAHGLVVAAGKDNGVSPTTWQPYDEYGISDQEWYAILHSGTLDGGLYRHPPFPDAAEAVRRLYWYGHEVHIVTARGQFQDGDLIVKYTEEALEEYAIPHTSLTTRARSKGDVAYALGLDYFLDDSYKNYTEVMWAGVPSYLMTRPWNQHEPAKWRVDTVDEFVDIILEEAGDE